MHKLKVFPQVYNCTFLDVGKCNTILHSSLKLEIKANLTTTGQITFYIRGGYPDKGEMSLRLCLTYKDVQRPLIIAHTTINVFHMVRE